MPMPKYKSIRTLVGLFLAQLLCGCSTAPVQTAGGSSGTEVSAVLGSIANPDGMAVQGAQVILRPTDYLSDSARSVVYTSTHSMYDTITSPDGTFHIGNLRPDEYTLEVTLGDSLSKWITFQITRNGQLVTLPRDTLLPVSKIVGNVQVLSDLDTMGYVQVYGLERSVKPDSNGNFSLLMPKGAFTIHLTATHENSNTSPFIGDMDVSLNVGSGESRHIGSFNLSSIAQPPCKNGSCDSLALRRILEKLGYSTSPLDSFCTWQNNRIIALTFREKIVRFIPREIVTLTSVESLDFGYTGIGSLPPEIGYLRSLKVLRLDGNNLVSLPPEIGNLTNCKDLNLSANKISSLPEAIVNISPSVLLDISGNKLCSITASIASWAGTYDPDWQTTQQCP